MPKQTFLNLPLEKQQRLLDAGFQEFSRVPADEASISKIIKLAEIPRGSFYQYFIDKYDLHAYIIEKYSKELRKHWIQLLNDEHGNLFAALPQFFEYFLDKIVSRQEVDFWKNTFSSFRTRSLVLLHKNSYQQSSTIDQTFSQFLDLKLLRIDLTDENMELLRSQLITMMIQSLHQYFLDQRLNHDHPRENAIKRFNLMLDWLEHGIRN